MWLTLFAREDKEATSIKQFKARAEFESRRKLKALRPDHGNELM
jgi:hypothetical protein